MYSCCSNNADAATRDGLPVGTTIPSLKRAMIALKVECVKRAKHGGYNLLWNFKEKIRTHLDLLSIPRLWGKKCQNV